MEILIVNHDREAAQELRASLEQQGCSVHTSPGITEALTILEGQRIDLLVAECRQLEMNGASLFRLLARLPHPPLILPTSSPLAADAPAPPLAVRVERLRSVVAQAQHLLAQQRGETLRVGDLVIDLDTKQVTLHDHRVLLPPIQFRLLAYLAQNKGRVVGAQELLKAVWGHDGNESEARELVKVHVRQIRRKLGLDGQRVDYVQSVRGFGYLVAPPGQGAQADANATASK